MYTPWVHNSHQATPFSRVQFLHRRDTKVPDFLSKTRADILAVTVGNVHGRYARSDPRLDLPRLRLLKDAAARASFPPASSLLGLGAAGSGVGHRGTLLAMHGASGLPDSQVQASIALGVCKFNVNTEVRAAGVDFLLAAGAPAPEGGQPGVKVDLLMMLDGAVANMGAVIEQKMMEFDPR